MKIPITFLGTSQAIPTAKRNHTAILLSYKSENILIDCGEGTQRQFRKLGINPCRLTKLLITHWHGDHILGIPGLLQTLALNGYNRTLEVYGPKGTKKFMELMYSLFVHKEKIKTIVREIEGKFFENSDFYLEAFPMKHGAPTNSYRFVEKDKIRINKAKLKKLKIKGKIISELAQGKDIVVNGKRIRAKDLTYLEPGKIISFILDTNLNANCYKSAENADLLISESTYTEKDRAEKYRHLTAKQAALIAKKSGAKKLILTHLSQRYENKEKLILNEARKTFRNAIIAEDLDKIEV